MTLPRHPFGKTGLSVTALGFGGAPIGYLPVERQQTSDVLNTLLDLGVNLIDTAASYKGSEALIGETIGRRRDEFILVSKCGSKIPESDAPDWSAELIARTIDRSLERLRTDRLDVMLLHTCSREVLDRGEALAALTKARQAGKIRFAGYSGDNETAAFAATLEDVAVIQTSINLADQRNIDVVLPACRERGLAVMAKRPIANAGWKDRDTQPGMYKEYSRTYTERLAKMPLKPSDIGLRDDNDGWTEMALRFTIGQPGVSVAIIGTTNLQHVRKNVEFSSKGPLPADAIDTIRRAFTSADPGGEWRGQG
jgi:aryl-alcohol dehydrogenase-like predicted oxidoreductase